MSKVLEFTGESLICTCPFCSEEFEIRKRGEKLVAFAEIKSKGVEVKPNEEKPENKPVGEKPDDKPTGEKDILARLSEWFNK